MTEKKTTAENKKLIPEKLVKQKMIPPQPKGLTSMPNLKNTMRRNTGRGR